MANLPYLSSPGNISKALTALQNAATPDRVSQDFVKTVLRIPGGSGDQMTSFLRRLGFAGNDGRPTERYKKFRNHSTSRAAMAEAMREAYAELFSRNEYTNLLKDSELKGLIVEITGNAADSRPTDLILTTFNNLKEWADFSPSVHKSSEHPAPEALPEPKLPQSTFEREPLDPPTRTIGLNLGYTINLNLPATSDIEVFDAIFKSLKANLLKDE